MRSVYDNEYEGLFASFYDLLHRTQKADIALFRALARETGSPVLDLGCGTGRILAPLVEDGHDVVGIDSAPEMLRLCREKIGDDRVRLHLGDMGRLELDERFRLILIVCNTLWYCREEADALDLLRRAKDHLAPGGRLVVDGSVPDVEGLAAACGAPEPLSIDDGPFTYRSVLTAEVDVATRIERDRIVLTKLLGDRVVDEAECTSALRLWGPDEVRALLAASGLRILDEWGSARREPLTSDSGEMIFVAESDADANPDRP